ncbi:peptidylprolyl isomerase [Planctomonas psychrotolerans]|uniref:peptidylprolyl isomerase n=1 Tax=Planctomonas psychrotolerans TaxID=2528712 RepID=UPI00123A52CE|nr:peptidylprolyl isomerase [Planctomonas psychrotolerans]
MASRDREARASRQRLREYHARQALHARRSRRRRRDNILAAIALAVVLALAIGAQVLYFTVGPGTPEAVPTETPSAAPTDPAGENVGPVPSVDVAESRVWTGELTLNESVQLGIELYGDRAPQATSVFVSLAQSDFYAGTTCHRLTTAILQCGSANGDGTGDPGYTWGPVENPPADNVYPAGTIAMARTASTFGHGSQFFVVYEDTPLDGSTGGYTVFGRVTSGLDALTESITSGGITPGPNGATDGAPVVPATITGVTVE